MNMKFPVVSIIIPVYNAQDYLRQCIDSILAQTFGDYELILVDDGSTDRSGAICDEYVERDCRIKVVHQQNLGLPSARKVGIDHAKGNYVLFVDADDWVDPNHLESYVIMAERERADVVLGGFVSEYPRKRVKCANIPVSLTAKEIILECLNNTLHAGVVFKLLRKELFENHKINFPKYNYFEDMYFTIEILLLANKIVSTGLTTYHYRFNHSSETHGKNAVFRIKKYNEFILNMQELFDNCMLWDDEDMRTALLCRINKEKLELLELPFSAREEIQNAYESYADSWKKYRVGLSLIKLSNYLALRYKMLYISQLYKHFRVIIRNILKGT